MPKSTQDVRTDVLALRDELIDNLNMIREAIAEDRRVMADYFKKFRDFRYRPITARDVNGNPTAWGQPTEVIIQPLATQLRTTVKSLIDSIRVIEGEILPEDDPEGKASGGTVTGADRAALRAQFKAEPKTATLPQPTDTETITRTPKEESNVRDDVKGPKPWRETKPGTTTAPRSEAHHVEKPKESEAIAPRPKQGPIGLSPALRATLQGSINTERLEAMKNKYKKPESE